MISVQSVSSPEEHVAGVGTMNHDVACSTVLELNRREIVEVWGTGRSDRKGTHTAVALETKLSHVAASKEAGVVRSMREMANHTPFLFNRRMLEYEGPLFVNMALQANCIDPGRKTSLL